MNDLARARERRAKLETVTLEVLLREHVNNLLTYNETGFLLVLYVAPAGGCPNEGQKNIAECECQRKEFTGGNVDDLLMNSAQALERILADPAPTPVKTAEETIVYKRCALCKSRFSVLSNEFTCFNCNGSLVVDAVQE